MSIGTFLLNNVTIYITFFAVALVVVTSLFFLFNLQIRPFIAKTVSDVLLVLDDRGYIMVFGHANKNEDILKRGSIKESEKEKSSEVEVKMIKSKDQREIEKSYEAQTVGIMQTAVGPMTESLIRKGARVGMGFKNVNQERENYRAVYRRSGNRGSGVGI